MEIKKTILHFCSWYPNRTNPLDGNFIQKHIRCIPKAYKNIVLSVYEDPNLKNKKYEIVENKTEGITQIILYHKASTNKGISIVQHIYYYLFAYRLIRKKWGKPNLIHAHVFLYAGVIGSLIHSFTGVPYFITEHSTIYHQNKAYGLRLRLIRWAAKKSRRILPVSHDLQQRMEKLNIKGNYQIIQNVVNTDLFYPVDSSLSTPAKILHVSTFNNEVKNIKGMLRAVFKVSQKRKDFVLQLIGEGGHKLVKEYIREIGLDEDLVEILGPLSEEEIAPYFREASFFVLFSNFETFSVVLAEAWSCGIPAIYSQSGGLTNWASPQMGIQIKRKDEKALEKAILDMLDGNYQKSDKKRLQQIAHSQFGPDQIGQKFDKLYSEVFAEGNR